MSPPRSRTDKDRTKPELIPPPSLQDRIVGAAAGAGSTAIQGTVELLKFAGGATLSTTGAIIAPPLKVTQQVIFPSLWEACKDYLNYATPKRVKDWFKIFSSSIYHFVTVLKNTHRGKIFRERAIHVGADILHVVSSDSSRQVIVDAVATLVKLAEALNTPQFKEFLDQSNLTGSRIVDAAASGRNKQLMNDIKEMTWSFVQLSSDPSTIIALAEVTAALCHALEMEDSVHRTYSSQRRQHRNAFTRQAYAERTLMVDPDTTVEQVLLSSLGRTDTTDAHTFSQNSTNGITAPEPTKDENSHSDFANDWMNAGKDGVNVNYLQAHIRKRAEQKERERILRTTITTQKEQKPANYGDDDVEDLVVTTVNETDDESESVAGNCVPVASRQSATKESNREKNGRNRMKDKPIGIQYEGQTSDSREIKKSTPEEMHASADVEQPVDRFYRYLDDMLQRRRDEAVKELGMKRGQKDIAFGTGHNFNDEGDTGKRNKKKTIFNVRSSWKRALKENIPSSENSPFSSKHNSFYVVVLLLILSVVTFWFAIGCYGIYVTFVPGGRKMIGRNSVPQIASNPSFHQEVTVRIIREVVHLTDDGAKIASRARSDLGRLAIDEKLVGECVANAVEGQKSKIHD